MSILREVCHCGHAKETHHETGACLGLGCNIPSDDWMRGGVTNECPFYRDASKPDTYRPTAKWRSGHPASCLCFDCKHMKGAA